MGDAYLNHYAKVYAYADVTASNAPVRKAFDWTRTFAGVPVRNPKSGSFTLDPGASQLVFSGVRATALDNTTQLAVTLSPLDPNVYRFTWTGVGTNPAFKVARSVSASGVTMAVTRNSNQSATFVASSGIFGAVVAGDVVFVPGPTTGDAASPFSTMNQGFWVVLSASTTQLVLARPAGTVFSAASESVVVTSNAQVLVFSAAGLQVGDQVQITGGFSITTQRTFTIYNVTATWFEVVSAASLPLETAIPATSGIAFYSSAKRYLRIESDQQVVVQVNGSTNTSAPMITPFSTGDSDQVGWFELLGVCFSLTLLNKSLQSANVQIVSAE